MQRVLIYDYSGMTLRFQPAAGSWSFSSGTVDGQVASLHTLDAEFPCLREGLAHSTTVHAKNAAPSYAQDAAADEGFSAIGPRSLLALTFLSLATGLLVLWPPSPGLVAAHRRRDLLLQMTSVEN